VTAKWPQRSNPQHLNYESDVLTVNHCTTTPHAVRIVAAAAAAVVVVVVAACSSSRKLAL